MNVKRAMRRQDASVCEGNRRELRHCAKHDESLDSQRSTILWPDARALWGQMRRKETGMYLLSLQPRLFIAPPCSPRSTRPSWPKNVVDRLITRTLAIGFTCVRLRYVAVALLVLAAGCERSATEFATNERTRRLTPDAARAIERTLAENFGVPQELVAWLELPVHFGRIHGTVRRVDRDESGGKLAITLAESPPELTAADAEILDGAGLLWLSGRNEGLGVKVAGYDASQRVLRLDWSLAGQPEVGDGFVVAGHILRRGAKGYRRHCVRCHGVNGDGNGPTAQYLNPRPRDFRLGVIKFTSTLPMERATRDDLKRTTTVGEPGTYMPSFTLLADEELDAILEYVRWLAMRGELEHRLVAEFEADYSIDAVRQRLGEGKDAGSIHRQLASQIKNEYPAMVEEWGFELASAWKRAEEGSRQVTPGIPRVPDRPESRRRGRQLFQGDKAKCATCHGVSGAGDGPRTAEYSTMPGTNARSAQRGLYDDWGYKIKPRHLVRGILRGGDRPIDVYRRIAAGVKGTPMPPAAALDDAEIWDLVNYVLHLPARGQ